MDAEGIKRTSIKTKIRQLGIIIGFYAEHIVDIQDKKGELTENNVVVTAGLINCLKFRMSELMYEREAFEKMVVDGKLSNYII